jgi:hypothetical protein
VKGYCPNTVMAMGKKKSNWTRQGDGEMCSKLCSENYKGIKNLEDLDLDGSLVLGV